MKKPSQWIAGIARGHNAGVCLLKDGKVVFSIEEERLSRHKYDGGPYASMMKILDYTDKLDYLVVAHTQNLDATAGKVDFTGDDVYTGLARKMGLIDRNPKLLPKHPQVVDLSYFHHKLHAALSFYNSGFDDAVAVIVDGAGTFFSANMGGDPNNNTTLWETESIYNCDYPVDFKTLYKHLGTTGPLLGAEYQNFSGDFFAEKENVPEIVISETAGIVKTYEAVTDYCGFSFIEAGKTMGLFPYGEHPKEVPSLFTKGQTHPLSDRNVIVPTYPNGALVNRNYFEFLRDRHDQDEDVTKLKNRRDMAYAVQTQTQEQVTNLIKKAVAMSGKKNVVLSGGYGLNCVANYHYLEALKNEGINLYVEPVSYDAGTAMGAALLQYRTITRDRTIHDQVDTLYNGPTYEYNEKQFKELAERYEAKIDDEIDNDSIVELLNNKNIVAIFQGGSENGPRALGNRSLLFDPSYKDGKDYVNKVKRREYFRPFAGTILEEDVHEWFDLRGMKSSPTMMYAVNCQPGMGEKIPSIIHVDGTCRIQTVNEKQNKNYYDLIKAFKEKTGLPIVFNTSFNLGGDPLVETLEDALHTLAKSDIEYLYLPEYKTLFTISN